MNKTLQKHIDKNDIRVTDDGKYLYVIGSVMGNVDMMEMPERVSDTADVYSLIMFIRADMDPCYYCVLMSKCHDGTVRKLLQSIGGHGKTAIPLPVTHSTNPYHIYPTKAKLPDADKYTPLSAEEIITISDKEWSGGTRLNKKVCLPMLEAMLKVSPWSAYYHTYKKKRNK